MHSLLRPSSDGRCGSDHGVTEHIAIPMPHVYHDTPTPKKAAGKRCVAWVVSIVILLCAGAAMAVAAISTLVPAATEDAAPTVQATDVWNTTIGEPISTLRQKKLALEVKALMGPMNLVEKFFNASYTAHLKGVVRAKSEKLKNNVTNRTQLLAGVRDMLAECKHFTSWFSFNAPALVALGERLFHDYSQVGCWTTVGNNANIIQSTFSDIFDRREHWANETLANSTDAATALENVTAEILQDIEALGSVNALSLFAVIHDLGSEMAYDEIEQINKLLKISTWPPREEDRAVVTAAAGAVRGDMTGKGLIPELQNYRRFGIEKAIHAFNIFIARLQAAGARDAAEVWQWALLVHHKMHNGIDPYATLNDKYLAAKVRETYVGKDAEILASCGVKFHTCPFLRRQGVETERKK